MEIQGIQNSQTISKKKKKKEQNWRTHTTWFPNSLQSNSNQDSVVLYNDTHIGEWNSLEINS